jgi:hypothetical protein
MQVERRALLTENVGDFMPLINQAAQAGETHWGIVFSSNSSMPRGLGTIGVFVESIQSLMQQHPGDDDYCDQVSWLQP